MCDYAYLKDYEVIAGTHSQVAVKHIENIHKVVWISRSICENGETLKPGDTLIGIKPYFADQEDLGWSHYCYGTSEGI